MLLFLDLYVLPKALRGKNSTEEDGFRKDLKILTLCRNQNHNKGALAVTQWVASSLRYLGLSHNLIEVEEVVKLSQAIDERDALLG